MAVLPSYLCMFFSSLLLVQIQRHTSNQLEGIIMDLIKWMEINGIMIEECPFEEEADEVNIYEEDE